MFKKSYFSKIVAFVMAISVSIISPVYALDIECTSFEHIPINIEELKDDILLEDSYTKDSKSVNVVSNIDRFKKAVKYNYPELTDFELGKTILISLGDTEEFVLSLPEEKVLEALDYVSLEVTDSFFKETYEGERIEKSESDFYAEVETANAIDKTNIVESDVLMAAPCYQSKYLPNFEDKPDSYLIIRTRAYKRNPSYALPGRDYFTIRGEVRWLKSPLNKRTDILAINSSGNVDRDYNCLAGAKWSTRTLDYFHTSYDYAYKNDNNGKGQFINIYTPDIYGVAVKTPLSFYGAYELDYVYAYYGISTQFDVSCQVAYSHMQLGIGSLGVSMSSSGAISFSASGTLKMKEYPGSAFTLYHGINYK